MHRGPIARAGLGLLALVASVGCQPAAAPPAPAAAAAPTAAVAPAAPTAPAPPAAPGAPAAQGGPPTPAAIRYSIAAKTAPLWNVFATVNQGFFAAEGI